MRCTSKFGATEAEYLCEIGCIPPEHRMRLMQSVVFHVSEYEEERTPHQIDKEIYAVYQRVESALWYLYRRERRACEFRRRMVDIRNQLKKLSKPARACLAFRNVQLTFEIPGDARAFALVVDPSCFETLSPDQVFALNNLFGALSGPIARKRTRGQPRKEREMTLYIFLRGAFLHATKGKASQDDFLAFCEEIKRVRHLTEWHPASSARLLCKRLGSAG